MGVREYPACSPVSYTATIGQMVRALSHRNLEGTGEFSSPGTVSVGQALAHLFLFLTLKYDSYQRRHLSELKASCAAFCRDMYTNLLPLLGWHP